MACGRASPPLHEGLYVYGHEVESFHPCGDTAAYWFVAPADARALLRARHDSITNKPYEPIFVRVRGSVSNEKTAGFAADYDGYFAADAILEARAARSGDCRISEFRK